MPGAPLKILYHHRIASKDGQAVHIDSLISALTRQGHRLEIVAPPGFGAAGFGKAQRLAGLKQRLPRVVYELLELLYNVLLLRRLRRAWSRQRPDVVYERYNLYVVAGILLARLHKTPFLLEVNAPLARERAAFDGLGLPRLAARLEQWVWRSADIVLPVSEVLAEILRNAGVAQERIVVIHNGIDPKDFPRIDTNEAKAALGLGGKTVLGFTGFVRRWHGLDRVIGMMAAPEMPDDLHLLLIGDGPARAELEAEVERLGLADRVTFAGLIGRDEIARHVAGFDIALQPQAVDYASPLKLFEYMALSKAIIAPDQANIREILTDYENALLFAPASDAALKAAVLKLATDRVLRERLGAAARRTIDERGYTWADNATRIAGIARCLLKGL